MGWPFPLLGWGSFSWVPLFLGVGVGPWGRGWPGPDPKGKDGEGQAQPKKERRGRPGPALEELWRFQVQSKRKEGLDPLGEEWQARPGPMRKGRARPYEQRKGGCVRVPVCGGGVIKMKMNIILPKIPIIKKKNRVKN